MEAYELSLVGNVSFSANSASELGVRNKGSSVLLSHSYYVTFIKSFNFLILGFLITEMEVIIIIVLSNSWACSQYQMR